MGGRYSTLDCYAWNSLIKRPKAEVHEELVSFFRQRVKFLLQEKGIRYDVIDAVIETSNYQILHLITLVQ